MYTKLEEYYMIIFRKSPKSFRANNYDYYPVEFKTYEDAEKVVNEILSDTSHLWNKIKHNFCEYIIVKYTNEPIKSFKNPIS